MKYNIDWFLAKGNSHKICQDYVAPLKNGYGIALSDGCSSSQNTDIGARLVVHEYCGLALAPEKFNIPEEALNCTWLRLKILEQEKCVRSNRIGDGCFAYKALGNIYVTTYEYARNIPYYYGYKIFRETDRFLSIEDNELRSTSYCFDEKFNLLTTLCTSHYQPEERLEKTFDIPLVGLEWIAIASDGLMSFAATPKKIFSEAFSFKNFNGKFVQRRMIRAMQALNNSNSDDISIGVIHFE